MSISRTPIPTHSCRVGGTEATEQLLRGTLGDTIRLSQGGARGGAEGRCSGRRSDGGGGRGDRRNRGGRDGGIEGGGDQEGADKLGEGGGPGEGKFRCVAAGRRSHMLGGSPDSQGERGLPWYRPNVGGLEGSGGDT